MEKLSILRTADESVEVLLVHGRSAWEKLCSARGKDAHLSQGAADESEEENPEREVPL